MEPTKEQKEKDNQRGKEEYMSNQTKTYVFRNRGLDIKMHAMDIISKRIDELDELADSQSGEEKMKTLAVIAQLGAAIIPD